MSICSSCQGREERACSYTGMTREYFRALIEALRYVAFRCGYALAVHGSLKSDIDLLAAPWRDTAVSAASLAEEIRKTAEQIIGCARIREADIASNQAPSKKPCGRLAWSFYLAAYDSNQAPYIDLSVMPKGKHADG